MSQPSLGSVVKDIVRAMAMDMPGVPDGELLTRYLAGRDADAFAALVRRHGPMVLGVRRERAEMVQPDEWRDIQPLLDRALHALPDKYREHIVLCEALTSIMNRIAVSPSGLKIDHPHGFDRE